MKRWLLALFAVGMTLPALAIEYQTVNAATILYDVPSQRGSKLFVIKRDTPVEVVVSLEGWSKVRDAEGGLAWIESQFLDNRRTVIVIADKAEARQGADEASPVVFEAEKNVALEYLEAAPGGWIKVLHRDDQTGYVRANQIWGL